MRPEGHVVKKFEPDPNKIFVAPVWLQNDCQVIHTTRLVREK
jgi:hypothetical protein